MPNAEAIANAFIDLADSASCDDLTPMKIQKLVYYAHGWHLALADKDLFVEPVEAWKFGPVIRSVYREFKSFRNSRITKKAFDVRFDGTKIDTFEPSIDSFINADYVRMLVRKVWDIYGRYTPTQLTNMTHEKGSPWDVVASHFDYKLPPGLHIPNELIKDYFKKLIHPVAVK